MTSTIAIIVTGVFLSTSSITPTESLSKHITPDPIVMEEGSTTVVSYNISIDTPDEELRLIKAAAEDAGMGFNYKKRGVKTRLVIDMVIDNEDGFDMERVTIKEGEEKPVQWMTDEEGKALSFVPKESLEFTKAIQ